MKKFEGKHLLMDTNLLIAISRDEDLGYFNEFLKQLETLNIKLVLEESTLFEFRRGSRTRAHLDAKNTFLELLTGGKENQLLLPSSTSTHVLENAEQLAILYSNKNPNYSKQISFVDCLVAAQLMHYKNHMCLATIDNNDYPLFIFDREGLVTIDTKKEIINIGIYTFNEKKYEKCLDEFKKTK